MEQAINNYSGLFICSSGNGGVNIDTTQANYFIYPGKYPCANILCVGGIQNVNSSIASISNYGATSVDMFAYCDYVEAITFDNNGFYYAQLGAYTSYAAPLVSAAAALLLSYNPNLSLSTIKNALVYHGESNSNITNLCVDGKQLNIYASFLYLHTHSLYYSDFDEFSHYAYCSICENTYMQSHVWTQYYGGNIVLNREINGQHGPTRYICTKCGRISIIPY